MIKNRVKIAFFIFVSLSVFNSCADSEEPLQKAIYSNINIFHPLSIDAGDDIEIFKGQKVDFLANIKSDSTNKIKDILWICDDEILSNDQNFSKSNFDIGKHMIKLKVTDEHNRSYYDQLILNVYPKICKIKLMQTEQQRSFVKYDDGYYQYGKTKKYTKNQDFVYDEVNNLVWEDDKSVSVVKRTYQEALEYCNSLVLGKYFHWDLPTKSELLSIVDHNCTKPAIDSSFSECAIGGYWTKDYLQGSKKYIWSINFIDGDDAWNIIGGTRYTRCVYRDNKCDFIKQAFSRDNEQDIVIDYRTGLIWQDDIDSSSIRKNFNESIEYCENLVLAGYDDWRLPNINELMSLSDKNSFSPSINKSFKNVQISNYWTSTTDNLHPQNGISVLFEYGSIRKELKESEFFIRCVRK